jgi:formate dehydrogenase major subunit
MSESALYKITINGQAVQARSGQTVMQAAAGAGIVIPGLCNHPDLKPEGSCRLCLVDIEKQRTLQPACTFPVFEGMVVQTETPKVQASRRFSLQLIFSERSHYCMYCQMSGSAETTDCELQKLGYAYGLDFWKFGPHYDKTWPLDATREFFVMDHSRCILCRRCIRACSQIAANHTLGVQQRGTRTMVYADDGAAFGKSTCVECGTCLQVCPTGALADRHSAYMGHESQVKRTAAACLGCAVGCGVEALTRDNQLLRVEGSWSADNEGLLCKTGRFDVVLPQPRRVVRPLVRQDGALVDTTWDKALTLVAERFGKAQRVAGLASPRLTNESLAAFACFFHDSLGSGEVGLLYGDVPPLDLGNPATLPEIARADCIAVIGGDPLKDQKVIGYKVKRAFDQGAQIIVVNDAPTDLDSYAHVHLRLQDISHGGVSPFERMRTVYHLRAGGLAQLRSSLEAAQRPVVLYGSGLSTTVYAVLRALPREKVRFLPLVKGTNAVGARRLGLTSRPLGGDALYVLAGDDMPDGRADAWPEKCFTVVQAAYRSRWTDRADVVLPARIWSEQTGRVINLEGKAQPVTPLVQAPRGVHTDWETLLQLSTRMGYTLSYEEIADISRAV